MTQYFRLLAIFLCLSLAPLSSAFAANEMMKKYANLSGNSGVFEYEIGDDYLGVRFRERRVYVYSYQSAGKQHVEIMKTLAEQGRGLNAYINKHVRQYYER